MCVRRAVRTDNRPELQRNLADGVYEARGHNRCFREQADMNTFGLCADGAADDMTLTLCWPSLLFAGTALNVLSPPRLRTLTFPSLRRVSSARIKTPLLAVSAAMFPALRTIDTNRGPEWNCTMAGALFGVGQEVCTPLRPTGGGGPQPDACFTSCA